MINLEKLSRTELIELSQDISYAIDMSGNEEVYTILDEVENLIALDEMKGELLNQESTSPSDIEQWGTPLHNVLHDIGDIV